MSEIDALRQRVVVLEQEVREIRGLLAVKEDGKAEVLDLGYGAMPYTAMECKQILADKKVNIPECITENEIEIRRKRGRGNPNWLRRK